MKKGSKVWFVEKIPQDDGALPLLVNRDAKILDVYDITEKKLKRHADDYELAVYKDVVDLEVNFKLSDLKDLHWSASAKSPERKLVVPGVYPGKNANQYFVKE